MEGSNEENDESPAGEKSSGEMKSGHQEAEMTLRDAAELTPQKESNVTLCPSPQPEILNPESQQSGLGQSASKSDYSTRGPLSFHRSQRIRREPERFKDYIGC